MADETIITPENDGPYHVVGNFKVTLPSGRVVESEGETWLCRCGGSKSKPFCDSTHSKIGFRAAEAAVAAADAAASGGGSGDDFEEVADSTVVPEGEVIGVDVAGQHVVVGRVDGQVYAIGGICTHQYAELEEGGLDGEIVMCPLHDSGFNIKTGAAVRLPASTPVPTYAVKEENGKIYVGRQPAAQS